MRDIAYARHVPISMPYCFKKFLPVDTKTGNSDSEKQLVMINYDCSRDQEIFREHFY